MRRWIAAATALLIVAALFGVTVLRVQAQDTGLTYYTVQPGDDLYRISLKFGLSVDVLARANGIVNPNIVYVGQRLIIPAGAILPTEPPMPFVIPATPASSAIPAATMDATAAATSAVIVTATVTVPPVAVLPTALPPAPTTYVVQPGDNLYRISLKFNTTVLILVQLNGLPNANVVFVGQVLKLPVAQPAPASPVVPGVPTAAPVVPPSAPTNAASNVGFSYGITAQFNVSDPSQVINGLKSLSMAWVRLPILWRTMETARGTIDYSSLDPNIDALNANGFKVLLTVSAAPDWARAVNTESGPPTDFADYANFVGALAARYKGKVLAFEIWDEPNIRLQWSGRPLSAASYVEMLRVSYAAIKQADPSIIVISAGLSPTGFNDGVNAINDRTFLRQAYAAGLASYSDAIGAHPTGWANPPDSTCCNASPGVSGWFNDRSFYFRDTLKDYRDIMTQNGDSGTFIWATQFGWGSSEGVVTDPNTVDTNYGFVKFVSQAQQAQYITRAFEVGRVLGYVGPMFVYNLNACAVAGSQPTSPDFRACYFSLENASGSPRSAFTALQAVQK